MGARLRSAIGTFVLVLLLLLAVPAGAEEYVACWTEVVTDPVTLESRPVTRCRLAGGELVDYASDSSIPVDLYPAAGTDLTGDCWYLTSVSAGWVFLNRYVNGDAALGWTPDPSNPGAIAVATGRIPRCTSEPNVGVGPASVVWEYVTSYIHPPPLPDLSPVPGDGVTGLLTFVGVAVPPDHSVILSAGGLSLEVFIEVTAVVVDWGDGSVVSFPTETTDLSGYPDGMANHTYETKNESGYVIDVGYGWTAKWRVPGDVWTFLDVPNTTTPVPYPVAEIVSVITG